MMKTKLKTMYKLLTCTLLLEQEHGYSLKVRDFINLSWRGLLQCIQALSVFRQVLIYWELLNNNINIITALFDVIKIILSQTQRNISSSKV